MIKHRPYTGIKPYLYICDVCKKEYETDVDFTEVQEFFNHRWVAGYDSLLDDGTEYEINVCQHCFHKAFGPNIREIRQAFMSTDEEMKQQIISDVADKLVDEWHSSPLSTSSNMQVSLAEHMKLTPEEYSAFVKSGRALPEDFLQRHPDIKI